MIYKKINSFFIYIGSGSCDIVLFSTIIPSGAIYFIKMSEALSLES